MGRGVRPNVAKMCRVRVIGHACGSSIPQLSTAPAPSGHGIKALDQGTTTASATATRSKPETSCPHLHAEAQREGRDDQHDRAPQNCPDIDRRSGAPQRDNCSLMQASTTSGSRAPGSRWGRAHASGCMHGGPLVTTGAQEEGGPPARPAGESDVRSLTSGESCRGAYQDGRTPQPPGTDGPSSRDQLPRCAPPPGGSADRSPRRSGSSRGGPSRAARFLPASRCAAGAMHCTR